METSENKHCCTCKIQIVEHEQHATNKSGKFMCMTCWYKNNHHMIYRSSKLNSTLRDHDNTYMMVIALLCLLLLFSGTLNWYYILR